MRSQPAAASRDGELSPNALGACSVSFKIPPVWNHISTQFSLWTPQIFLATSVHSFNLIVEHVSRWAEPPKPVSPPLCVCLELLGEYTTSAHVDLLVQIVR